MTRSKIIASFLAVLMLAGMLAACGGGGTPAETQKPSGGADATSGGQATEAATTADPREIDELPTDKDYKGYKYRVLTHLHPESSIAWLVCDVWTEAENGERINDAVFARNLAMDERFNAKVTLMAPDNAPATIARTAVTAGSDDFDLLQTTVQNQASLAIQGYVLNMATLPYINFDKAWWDKSANESMRVGPKIYYAIGDSQINALRATWGILFNKKLVQDANIPSLYDSVREGKWTLDLLKEYGKRIAQDINGDGKMEWGTDVFGLGLQDEVVLPLLLGSGEKIVDIKADGSFQYNLNSEANMNAMEKIWNFMCSDNSWILNANRYSMTNLWIEFRNQFMADKIGFYMGHLSTPNLVAGDMMSDFGIVPFPKVNPDQDGYYSTFQYNNAHAITLPRTASDPDRSALLTEAYEMFAHTTIRPAFYDFTLTLRSARDTESGEMLDIIFANRNLDITLCYNSNTNMQSTLQGIASTTSFTFASTEASARSSIQAGVKEIIDTLLKEE